MIMVKFLEKSLIKSTQKFGQRYRPTQQTFLSQDYLDINLLHLHANSNKLAQTTSVNNRRYFCNAIHDTIIQRKLRSPHLQSHHVTNYSFSQ